MAVFNFDGEVAKIVGVNGAVLFWNIAYWIEKNRANKKHFHDGRYWTYNSMKAFEELFPFMTTKQVRNALDKLIDAELVITGDYNEKGFDKTKWYALTTYGEDLSKGQKDLPKRANASAQKGKPIPNINTDNKPNKEKELDTNVSNSKKKESQKHRYGEYRHVLLTDKQVDSLKQKFGDKWLLWVQTLDEGIELKGYHYNNHYLAILRWAKKDEVMRAPQSGMNADYLDNL